MHARHGFVYRSRRFANYRPTFSFAPVITRPMAVWNYPSELPLGWSTTFLASLTLRVITTVIIIIIIIIIIIVVVIIIIIIIIVIVIVIVTVTVVVVVIIIVIIICLSVCLSVYLCVCLPLRYCLSSVLLLACRLPWWMVVWNENRRRRRRNGGRGGVWRGGLN